MITVNRVYHTLPLRLQVQYIDLRDRFTGDMLTMQILARTLGYMYPTLDFAWMLKVILNCVSILDKSPNSKVSQSNHNLKFIFIFLLYHSFIEEINLTF